ncbi:uncharacterized protein ARMOST_16545 [Armillaria ostoyae]|uniref:Uncharacterized protein n=1 Tax=Armillaria ostoyae TaxID=47428 RepID=A0A284RWH0_ARMOS|nr:uncharacterized protein ARMOST_16545 [Armillaria ostoyae]
MHAVSCRKWEWNLLRHDEVVIPFFPLKAFLSYDASREGSVNEHGKVATQALNPQAIDETIGAATGLAGPIEATSTLSLYNRLRPRTITTDPGCPYIDVAQKQTGVKAMVVKMNPANSEFLWCAHCDCSTARKYAPQTRLVREGFYFSRPSSNFKMRIFRI